MSFSRLRPGPSALMVALSRTMNRPLDCVLTMLGAPVASFAPSLVVTTTSGPQATARPASVTHANAANHRNLASQRTFIVFSHGS